MKDNCILLRQPDYKKLSGLISAFKEKRRTLDVHIKRLENELETAEIVPDADFPDDVVTIGSKAQLRDVDTNEVFTTRLVFPAELDGTNATVSVLSPLGVAIIGEKAGAKVSCMAPAGEKQYIVESASNS